MSETAKFIDRTCAICGSRRNSLLTRLSAKQVAENNWSYRNDYASILELDDTDTFDIVSCQDCDFIYAKTLPDQIFLEALYEQVIDLTTQSAEQHYKNEYSRRCRYLSTLAALLDEQTNNRKVLDYGAGFGQTSSLLKAQGMKVVAYETSALRQQNLSEIPVDVARSVEQVTVNGPYRVIICDNVLEHVPQPNEEMELFKSILEPGGLLFISVPSYEADQVKRMIETLDMSLNPWEHLNYFSIKHLDRLALQHGFIPVEAQELKNNIDIGLRAEHKLVPRLKNGAASLLRLLTFIISGQPPATVNSRFYRAS